MALIANLLLAPKLADSVAALHRRYAGLDQLAEYKRQLESPSDTMARLQADTSPQADVSEAFELAQQRLATTQLEQKADGKQAQNVNRDDEAMPPECEAMWMHDKYQKTFVDTLTRRKIKQYLEWGGGGSTLCSSRLVEQVTTIEHNEEWCKLLREQLQDKNVTNVNLICSAVEWTQFGTSPEGDGTYEEFHDYVDAIDTLDIPHFDVVFIDGRARVPCAKKALGYISSDSVLMVHDFQREFYHTPMLQWYEELEKFIEWPELGVLKPKL
ncbi:uncharacterized protein ACA1_153030 [Acanthamoeba castellanii str. Neff]|uniref:Uncharacterized protein n=1 Tax=Acanthamoeba castellanii (strain ATCC 30010 / Neff) TaxID=1257118 RepID=L8HF44_ACACF|nr:uncharacterized protein ACA1_153030 [Acanthamoeba castellanii str. Neff]ELR24104.1 hypothetical protein ACA1_153030 [Acanthamoeba castellanii str. Neff]